MHCYKYDFKIVLSPAMSVEVNIYLAYMLLP